MISVPLKCTIKFKIYIWYLLFTTTYKDLEFKTKFIYY